MLQSTTKPLKSNSNDLNHDKMINKTNSAKI